MKKNILITLIVLSISSLSFAGTIQPQLSMRFNDIVEQSPAGGGTLKPALVLGFAMSLDEGVYAGFDSDGIDSRIFVSFDYGTIGMGMSAFGDPQFTVGAKYSTLSNLEVSLDYVVNNLVRALDGNGDPLDDGTFAPNELRLSLGVTF
jgi:hypothetical protein